MSVGLYGDTLRIKEVEGIIALSDEPKKESIQAVQDLIRLGVTPIMLTGDNRKMNNVKADRNFVIIKKQAKTLLRPINISGRKI